MRTTPAILTALCLLALSACGKDDQVNLNQAPSASETTAERAASVRDAFKEAPADTPANEQTTRDIQRMFDRLAIAGRAYNKDGALVFVDFDAMFEVVTSDADKAELRGSARTTYVNGLKTGARRNWFREGDGMFDWVDVKVMRVDTSADGKLAVAYVRHIQDDYGWLEKMRWWLVNAGQGWRLYDWEYLTTSIRASRLMRQGTSETLAQSNRSAAASTKLEDSRLMMGDGDYEGALANLLSINGRDLGTELNAVRYQYMAECQIAVGKPEEALLSVKQALSLKRDLPEAINSRAGAKFALKQYEEALADYELYIHTLGSDPTALANLADCLTWLDRNDEAIETYRKSLQDWPTQQSIIGLALLIDPADASEIGDWFSKLRLQDEQYYPLASELYDRNRLVEATGAINEAYRKVKPQDTDLAWYTAKVALDREQPKVAAAALKPAIKSAPEDKTRAFTELYWIAMARAGDAATALREAGRTQEAFSFLASECHDNWNADALDALCEEFRRDNEQNLSLHFYLAEADFAREDYKAAEEHFRAGWKLTKPDGGWRLGLLHGLLDSMNLQERGLEGYTEVGGTQEAFVYLAGLLAEAEKTEPLQALIDAHAKEHADDPEILHFRGELAWLNQEWKEAATLLSSYLANPNGTLGGWWILNHCVRAAIRAGDFELAEQEATKGISERDNYLLILVYAANDKPAEAIKAVDAFVAVPEDPEDAKWWITDLYDDEDVGEKLRGEAYAQLHERFPMPEPKPEPEPEPEPETPPKPEDG